VRSLMRHGGYVPGRYNQSAREMLYLNDSTIGTRTHVNVCAAGRRMSAFELAAVSRPAGAFRHWNLIPVSGAFKEVGRDA